MSSSQIIVVEDNIDFATILETVLRMWGYSVQLYDTLASARAALKRAKPSMLVLDGQLPDGEGLDLYHELRRTAHTRTLPILLLSVSDDVYQAAGSASISDPHLHVGLKPMPLDDIQDIVARLVGS